MSDDVQEVYYMMTYVLCDYTEDNMQLSSKERMALGREEFLTFMKVDADLNEEEYFFDSTTLSHHDKLTQHLLSVPSKKLNLGATNMRPIISAFNAKGSTDCTSPV